MKLIRVAEALHSEVSRGLAADQITASQFSALKALRYHGPMPQKDIASYLLKSAGNVTLVLDNLEKRGFVTRTRQTDDRRVIFVSLTQIGCDTFDRLYPAHIGRIQKAMQGLDTEKLDQLQELLQCLRPSINDPQCQLAAEQSQILPA